MAGYKTDFLCTLVTLRFRAAQLYSIIKNCADTTIFVYELRSHSVWNWWWHKSYLVYCEQSLNVLKVNPWNRAKEQGPVPEMPISLMQD